MPTSSITNLGANSARNYIDIANAKANIAISQLSGGKLSIIDNPASAAVGYNMSSTIQSLQQAQRNVSQATSMIQSITGFLGASADVLSTMGQLSVAANSDTIGDSQRQMMDAEFQSLLNQINLNADNARWGGASLLNGGSGAVTPQAAAVAAPTVVGGAAGAGTYFAALGTAFTAASTQGYINGAATEASVKMNGAMYEVSITVGGQSFKGTTTGGAASLLLLQSTTDSGNIIALTTTGAFAGAAAVQTDLETQLGITTGNAGVFSSINTTAGGMAGVTLTAGAGTKAGAWALSYTVNAGQGTFKITNGLEQYTATVVPGGALTESVTFNNGATLALAAFNGAASVAQNIYSVAAGTSVTQSFQFAEKASDVLSVTFNGATTSALGLTGLNVLTKENAALAGAAISLAQQQLNTQIGAIGGAAIQFNFMTDTLRINIENTQAAMSTFVDTDIPSAMQDLQTFKSLAQVAQSTFTQALGNQSNMVQMIQSMR